jgi:hypothetical protein
MKIRSISLRIPIYAFSFDPTGTDRHDLRACFADDVLHAAAARACGLATAFVLRPREHGPAQTTDLEPEQDWDVVASDFNELAQAFGT